jgi:hypothetical protein
MQGEKAGSTLRTAALLAIAAVALHELRYALVGAPVAGGHSYLHVLTPPLLVGAVAVAAISVLAPAIRRRVPRIADPSSGTERAAAYALALLAIFVCQELAEALATGSPADLVAAVAGTGGWLALPLAMALGALVEFARRVLERAEVRVAAAVVRRAPRRAHAASRPLAPDLIPVWSRPLAFGLSRRPPPLAA